MISAKASPVIKEVYEKYLGSSPSDSRIEKDVSLLVKKIPSYLPVITNALFRFFDQDGSGTISKEEVVISFGSIFSGGPDSGPNMKLFVPAVFRMIDENQNGSIEAVEVQPLLTEVITSVAKVLLSVIGELEKDIKVGMKNKALKKIQRIVDKGVENGMPFPVPADFMTDMLLANPLNEEGIVGFAAYMEMLTPEIIAGYDAFADRFKALSQGNPVPIKKAAALLAETIVSPICAFADPELAAAMLPMLTAGMPLPIPLEMLDLGDVLNAGCAVVSAYLKSGGVKRFLEAFLSFLDVNNDQEITWEELNGLWVGVMEMKAAGPDGEKVKAAMCTCFNAVLKMLDSDGSGTFDMDDAPKLYDKAAELIVAVMCLGVELTKSVAVAMVLPALNLGFQMFTEDGCITTEMVTAILGE
jgi:Ca2+-binding EF-hand superfamily protein